MIVKFDSVVTRDDYGGRHGTRTQYELQQVTHAGTVAPATTRPLHQYDGKWTFTFDWNSSCTGFKPVTLFTIKDSRIAGRLDHPRINLTDISGKIAADGSVTMTLIGLGKGTGRGQFGATSASGSAEFNHVDFAGPCTAVWRASHRSGGEASPPSQTSATKIAIPQDRSSSNSSTTYSPSIEARLTRLQHLLDKKLISQAEFATKRQQILDDL